MLNKDVLSPKLFGLHIDELGAYMDEINGDSPCLFNTMVAILFYVDDVVMKVNRYESLDGNLKKEAVVDITCWELQSHLFKLQCFLLSCMTLTFGKAT